MCGRIADPIDAAAVYREGVLGKLPRPERFAIHKLIVADRRLEGPDSRKARKDLMQVELLASALAEDRPADLAEAYADAIERGPKWRASSEASSGFQALRLQSTRPKRRVEAATSPAQARGQTLDRISPRFSSSDQRDVSLDQRSLSRSQRRYCSALTGSGSEKSWSQ